jgi:hypothetical protein
MAALAFQQDFLGSYGHVQVFHLLALLAKVGVKTGLDLGGEWKGKETM